MKGVFDNVLHKNDPNAAKSGDNGVVKPSNFALSGEKIVKMRLPYPDPQA